MIFSKTMNDIYGSYLVKILVRIWLFGAESSGNFDLRFLLSGL